MVNKDYVGKKFGRLLVLDVFHQAYGTDGKYLACRCACDCGKNILVRKANLQNGTSKSCGCLARDARTVHGGFIGGKKPELYNIWDGMLRRSSGMKQAQRSKTYTKISKEYGVYEPWRSFQRFCEDMGPRPTKNHSLDRIDNSKGYFPGNCRWATKSEQVLNRGRSREHRVFGEMLTVREISEKYGISKTMLHSWNSQGRSLEEMIVNYKPIKKKK